MIRSMHQLLDFPVGIENPNATSDSEGEEEEEDEEVLGPKIAIATLDAAHHPHASVDLAVSLVPIVVSHNGSSSVFLAGYSHPADFPAGEEDFDDYDSEEEEDLEEIDYEEEEGVPNGVPLADSDEEEEEEEESEEEPSPVPVVPAAGKRKGAAKAAQPKPTKKAKAAEPVTVAAATPASADDYISALKEVVKAKGSVRLADLGSAVKRPAKAPKLKVAIDKNKQLFKYDAKTDLVSLA